jgi:hypothetical protein
MTEADVLQEECMNLYEITNGASHLKDNFFHFSQNSLLSHNIS